MADVRRDCPVGQVNATLKDATRETCQCLSGRRGVDGGKTTGVPGVEELQQVVCLASSYFAEDDTVWAMPQDLSFRTSKPSGPSKTSALS